MGTHLRGLPVDDVVSIHVLPNLKVLLKQTRGEWLRMGGKQSGSLSSRDRDRKYSNLVRLPPSSDKH